MKDTFVAKARELSRTPTRKNDRPSNGANDDLTVRAVKDRLHVHDLHATILYLLGIENLKLTYKYKGRPENPTLNEGEAYKKIAG